MTWLQLGVVELPESVLLKTEDGHIPMGRISVNLGEHLTMLCEVVGGMSS